MRSSRVGTYFRFIKQNGGGYQTSEPHSYQKLIRTYGEYKDRRSGYLLILESDDCTGVLNNTLVVPVVDRNDRKSDFACRGRILPTVV